jgi:16S rRNA U1498 N3-methylase RsmE
MQAIPYPNFPLEVRNYNHITDSMRLSVTQSIMLYSGADSEFMHTVESTCNMVCGITLNLLLLFRGT